MMKAYKLEVLIIDFDNLGGEGIKSEIENANYPNDCLSPEVMNIEEAEIGEWHDEHPLNKYSTMKTEFEKLFSPYTNKQ